MKVLSLGQASYMKVLSPGQASYMKVLLAWGGELHEGDVSLDRRVT